jgi:hypothetical protein
MFLRKNRPNPHRGGVFLVFAATVVTILFFVCSIVVRTLPEMGASPSVPLSVEPAATVLMQLNFWHAALYFILALASVICVACSSSPRRAATDPYPLSGAGEGLASVREAGRYPTH